MLIIDVVEKNSAFAFGVRHLLCVHKALTSAPSTLAPAVMLHRALGGNLHSQAPHSPVTRHARMPLRVGRSGFEGT